MSKKESGRRNAIVEVSVEHLRQSLHMPEDAEIIAIQVDYTFYPVKLKVVVNHSSFPVITQPGMIPTISPTVEKTAGGDYVWDWNLGK